jgi:hypothetical protein
VAVAISQTANPAGAASASSVATYSTVSIGTASSDRIIVVCVTGEDNGGANPNSATLDYGSGDTAMTAGTLASSSNTRARTFYLAAPTGTTGTVKVTWSADVAATENHIVVLAVTGATSSPTEGTDTSADMDATDPLTTGSITIPANGGFIAAAADSADAATHTWANATVGIDEDAGLFRMTTATSTSSGTVTVTCTGTTNGAAGSLAYLIWSPAQKSFPFRSTRRIFWRS